MSPAGRRALAVLALLAALLFAGRAVADFLAERWWTASASGTGAIFATRWALLELSLEAGAILIAVAWFAGNLLLAARLVGRVAADEQVAVRGMPPLTSAQLRLWGVAVAVLLGLLCGAGTAEWAATVALARRAPWWGVTDALNQIDLGFYIAMLPALARLQFFGLALTLLGLAAAVMAYAAGGALRVAARQFAIDPGVRLHLGLLGAAFGAVLGLGYLLEPYEFAAGLRPATGAAHVVLLGSLSRMLAGVAFAAGALTLYWGLRGRIMLPMGAWATFGLFALAIRLMAPAAGAIGEWDRTEFEQQELEREAFAMPELMRALPARRSDDTAFRRLEGMWDPRAIAPPEGARWVGADRIAYGSGEGRRSVLLLVSSSASGAAVFAVSDDEVAPGGQPLSRQEDGAYFPGLRAVLQLGPQAPRPGAGLAVLDDAGPEGVRAGSFLRRLLLTWSLQRNLLGTAPDARVAWRLDPRERLAALAPFVEWGTPRPRLVDNRLLWLSDGYLYSAAFPAVAAVPWRGRAVSFLRAAFVGVVEADGRVRIFERGATDPLSLTWAAIAQGLVEPPDALPAGVAAELHYPEELFAAHATVLRRRHWHLGSLVTPPAGVSFDSIPGPVRRAGYQGVEGRRLLALLEGERLGGVDQLRVLPFDTAATVDSPAILPARWERLPFVQQTRDTAAANGWRFVPGPVRFAPAGENAILAWQVAHAIDTAGQGSVAAVNLAWDGRLGTGRDAASAWENLQGLRAAFPESGADARRVREAREWFLRADSALRQGDLTGFGRAFEALRAILTRPGG